MNIIDIVIIIVIIILLNQYTKFVIMTNTDFDSNASIDSYSKHMPLHDISRAMAWKGSLQHPIFLCWCNLLTMS